MRFRAIKVAVAVLAGCSLLPLAALANSETVPKEKEVEVVPKEKEIEVVPKEKEVEVVPKVRKSRLLKKLLNRLSVMDRQKKIMFPI